VSEHVTQRDLYLFIIIVIIDLRVPTRYLRDFSAFNFGPTIKIVRYSMLIICRDFETFKTRTVFLGYIL
jgi:hypothetical protein